MKVAAGPTKTSSSIVTPLYTLTLFCTLHRSPHCHAGVDEDVLAEHTAGSECRSRTNMGMMPDKRPATDRCIFNDGGFVNEVVGFRHLADAIGGGAIHHTSAFVAGSNTVEIYEVDHIELELVQRKRLVPRK